MRGFKYAAFGIALSGLCAGTASASDTAGEPFGPEFVVNSTTASVQRVPAIASNAAGGTVVVWQDVGGAPNLIRARRFSAIGQPFGNDQVVATGFEPAVAMNATDGFVIVFNSPTGLRFSLFGDDGATIKDAVLVDSTTGSTVSSPRPSVGMDANGRFVIAYFRAVGGVRSILARRFDFGGDQIGSDIVVSGDGDECESPVVAVSSIGRFIVGCVMDTVGAMKEVRVQVYESGGTPVGIFEEVNGQESTTLSNLRAAMDASGNSLLAWSLDANHINARYVGADSAGQGDEFEVVSASSGPGLTLGGISMSAEGEAVITWDTRGGGGAQVTGSDIFARRYNKTHVARDAAGFQVNSTTPRPHLHQFGPSVALDADGDFTIAWQDGDTGNADIRAQRFVGPENVDVSLVISDAPDPVAGGQPVTYTFQVTNGHADVTPIQGASAGITRVNESIGSAHTVVLRAILPSGVSGLAQSGSNWAQCSFVAPNLTCAYSDILLPGDSTSLLMSMNAPTSGSSMQVVALEEAYQLDNNSGNSTDSETTTLTGNPAGRTVQFAAASSTHGEALGARTVTVTLSSAPPTPVTVNFAADPASTATETSDYLLSASPLVIPANETTGTITVTIVDDAAPEPSETVVLRLSSPSAGTELGTPVTHTFTITDNDSPALPTVEFRDAAQSSGEEDGPVTVIVDLSAASTQPVTVNYALSGTATNTTDYSAAPAGSLTIPAGQTSGTINVTPVNDSADESNETVVLTLSAPTNATLGATTTHTLTLEDNDAPATPSVQFAEASESASEGDGVVTVDVQLSAASTQAVTVSYTVGGTATNGADYSVTPAGSVTIPAGQTAATVTIAIIDDSTQESTETVELTLGAPSNATLGSPSVYTLSIADNDTGGGNTVSIEGASGRTLTFNTNRGTFSALSRASRPPSVPAGLDYPEGFFSYQISGVSAGAFVVMTVTMPAGSSITDWVDCPQNSCYRYGEADPPLPGQANIVGDTITIVLQDNGAGDDDPRPGIISSKVAAAQVRDNEGGALSWLMLLPLFGVAIVRRRRF